MVSLHLSKLRVLNFQNGFFFNMLKPYLMVETLLNNTLDPSTFTDISFPDGSVGKEAACNVRRFLSGEDPLGKGMATHSSILVWRIPWTEEPGRLQPMGHKELDTTEWLTLSFI